jgi:hypothetical protein
MLSLTQFTILFLLMALASGALGYCFPPCLLQQPAKWTLYLVAGLLMSIVLYTLLTAWALR